MQNLGRGSELSGEKSGQISGQISRQKVESLAPGVILSD